MYDEMFLVDVSIDDTMVLSIFSNNEKYELLHKVMEKVLIAMVIQISYK